MLYVGDYNITASSDPSYQIIVSNAAPNGTRQGAGVDPFNPGNNPSINWHSSSAGTNLLAQETDNCEFIQYRDDLEMMTTNVYSGAAGGLKYVPGTYHTFGNNGSVKISGHRQTPTPTPRSISGDQRAGFYFLAAQLPLILTGASDHLPVVADYTIPVPAPVITGFNIAGTNLVFNIADCVTGGVYAVLTATNLSVPPANWTALATNVANGGSFTLTATNAADPNAPNRFYLLQQQYRHVSAPVARHERLHGVQTSSGLLVMPLLAAKFQYAVFRNRATWPSRKTNCAPRLCRLVWT